MPSSSFSALSPPQRSGAETPSCWATSRFASSFEIKSFCLAVTISSTSGGSPDSIISTVAPCSSYSGYDAARACVNARESTRRIVSIRCLCIEWAYVDPTRDDSSIAGVKPPTECMSPLATRRAFNTSSTLVVWILGTELATCHAFVHTLVGQPGSGVVGRLKSSCRKPRYLRVLVVTSEFEPLL